MSKCRARLERFNIGNGKKIRWIGPTSLFNCSSWFRIGAITNKCLLQNPHRAAVSNLQRWGPFFPRTKQLMSHNFVYSRDMVLNGCIQIWFLCRQSNLKCTRESGFMDRTLKWILCKVNNEDLASGPHFLCVYKINCWLVCVQVCMPSFRYQADGALGSD